MNTLLDNVERATNTTRTLNNAVTHKSSLIKNLDLSAQAGGLRNTPEAALPLFQDALFEDPRIAAKNLFHIRDVRGGMGERQIFRICMDWMARGTEYGKALDTNWIFNQLLKHAPHYGRWDDVIRYYPGLTATTLITEQWKEDTMLLSRDEPISLLAKWLPSISASNTASKLKAKKLASSLGLTQKQYRKALGAFRKHIDVVERRMCAGDWEGITFEHVPSQAMKRLRKAFSRNQTERFGKYIENVTAGETKIQAGTLTPDQLVKSYMQHGYCLDHRGIDAVIEEQWKALPKWGEPQNLLPICDTSGSMYGDPIIIALSLTLYISERNATDLWKNKFITFSSAPEFVQINPLQTLKDKLCNMAKASWGMSTNIEAAMKLILDAAGDQHDLPDSIVIISDMEFDECSQGDTNFRGMQAEAEERGLTLPNVVFWNVNAMTKQAPVTYDEGGAALVSGRSPAILKMAFDGNFNPLSFFMDAVVNNPRYDRVELPGIAEDSEYLF